MPSFLPNVYYDNLEVVEVVLLPGDPIMHSKSRHLKLGLHFLCDQVHKKHLQLIHLPTYVQVTDILTKFICATSFHVFKDKLLVVFNPIIIHLRGYYKNYTIYMYHMLFIPLSLSFSLVSL